jgi:Zn-dependent peptidase ImmA (M78 family)/transcriptional regulator with XRE-family HTH domain
MNAAAAQPTADRTDGLAGEPAAEPAAEPALDLSAARRRAVRRRAAGVVADFDPARLALARRLAGMPRARLAQAVEVTAAAVTQFEKGLTKPTVPVVEQLSRVLGVPPEFFRAGQPVPSLPAASAHFRSLRATTSLERERALAFAELTLAVFTAVEQYVDLPPPALPDLDVPPDLTPADVTRLAGEARRHLGLDAGPVPHMVRLLEAHGVVVVRLDSDDVRRVDAFCHHHGGRPVVLLNPAKGDKARSRFDAAHELGHLLMHHDTEPGSRLVENQANAFAAEFLAPAAEIADALPGRIDWVTLQALKRHWGVSVKALVYRSHVLGRFDHGTYQRALRGLAEMGLPEPGSLGPPETPVLLARALGLMGGEAALSQLCADTGLPASSIDRVARAAGVGQERPVVTL